MKLRFYVSIFLLCVAAPPVMSYSAGDVSRAVKRLEQSQYVRVGLAGKSVHDRDIPYVVVTDLRQEVSKKLRVLVMAGQHGNELAASEGMVALLEYIAFSNTQEAQSFRRNVLLVVVPLMNPDGAANATRVNGIGMDLNRDWVKQSQPEVRAVVALEKTWAPSLLFDEHEWLKGDQSMPDFIETSCPEAANFRNITLSDPALSEFKSIDSRREASNMLAHRYFASRGVTTFLVETNREQNDRTRISLYRKATLRIIQTALSRIDADSRKAGWCVPSMLTRNAASRKPPVCIRKPGSLIPVIIACYLLLVVFLSSLKNRKNTAETRGSVIRVSDIMPRHEHDLAYWMSHRDSALRGASEANHV